MNKILFYDPAFKADAQAVADWEYFVKQFEEKSEKPESKNDDKPVLQDDSQNKKDDNKPAIQNPAFPHWWWIVPVVVVGSGILVRAAYKEIHKKDAPKNENNDDEYPE